MDQVKKRLLSVDEYHKMAEVGILAEDDRVELINGEIIRMSPINSSHTSCVKRLNALLFEKLGRKVVISVQDPITLGSYSEPEPDLAVLKASDDFYARQHPRPEDVHLVIEVSDSTLSVDQGLKLSLYAEAGIPEYWIINLPEQQVEVYQHPKGKQYGLRRICTAGDVLSLPPIGVQIGVDEMLPKELRN